MSVLFVEVQHNLVLHYKARNYFRNELESSELRSGRLPLFPSQIIRALLGTTGASC